MRPVHFENQGHQLVAPAVGFDELVNARSVAGRDVERWWWKMIDKKPLRKHLFVDPKVQGALATRAVLYWFLCLLTVALMLLCWQMITGPARLFYTHLDVIWYYYGPALIASTILLPLVVIDVFRVSNRFVGPILRLRRSLRALGRGEHVGTIEFRDGDFWQEFADEFNVVADRVEQLEQELHRLRQESDKTDSGELETAACDSGQPVSTV